MQTIILIAGRPRHGKDTHAIYLRNELDNLNISNEIMSFAQAGKDILFDMGLITLKPELKEIERPIMRKFMNAVCKKHMGEHVWVTILLSKIHGSDAECIMIPDWRFPIETTVLRNAGFNVHTFYVTRPDLEVHDKAPEENALKPSDADCHVINKDITSVKENVKIMLEMINAK